MTQIAVAHSFISALGQLDRMATDQTIEFLEQLITRPESVPAEMDVGQNPLEYCAEALQVNDHLRVIGRRDADTLLLLYVGLNNDAYDWATSVCVAHNRPRAGRRISAGEIPRGVTPGLPGVSMTEAWYCPLSDTGQLREAMEVAGISRPLY